VPDDRHTAAFVVGAVLGGLAGAAMTLWKTPQSGAELRAGLSQGVNELTGNDQHSQRPPLTSPIPGRTTPARLSSRALEYVERAAAPIVGVKLGQTANNSGAEPATPVVVVPETPVAATTESVPSETAPVETVPPEAPEGLGHAASTEELTHPQEGAPTPMAQQTTESGEPAPFPDLDKH
jgi:hypothetical protein